MEEKRWLLKNPLSSMEDELSFYIFLFLPWKKIFSVKISFVFHGRRVSFLHFFVSSMEDGRFFSVQPLSAAAEAPCPFDFLVSGAQRGWRFMPSSFHLYPICLSLLMYLLYPVLCRKSGLSKNESPLWCFLALCLWIYSPLMAATPGRPLPSMASSRAPPPVEM